MRYGYTRYTKFIVVAALALVAQAVGAQQAHHTSSKAPTAAKSMDFQPGLEPRAIAILKASSAVLASAQSMAFTAVVSYESPSRLGPPLIYSTRSEVMVQRPDKLKVITVGDGPSSEFYYDGKTMVAYEPGQNLIASANAPTTIDATLKAAYDTASIYFPFADVIVANPYADIEKGLKTAFYVGQSGVVGDTATDIVAYVTGDVFVQIWIGQVDNLPRRIYAIYLNDPARLRHVLELSNWAIGADFPSDPLVSSNNNGARRIPFERPEPMDPAQMRPAPKNAIGTVQVQ
jgi:hypothetical protein